MSGGRFDYLQNRISDIAKEIDLIIKDNRRAEFPFSKSTIREFKKGVKYLRLAQIYAERVDMLVSGDDGEDDFHRILKEELGHRKTCSSYKHNKEAQ